MYRSVGGRCQTGVGWRMTGRWDIKPVEVGNSGRLAVKGWDFPFGPAVWSWICLCGPEVEMPRKSQVQKTIAEGHVWDAKPDLVCNNVNVGFETWGCWALQGRVWGTARKHRNKEPGSMQTFTGSQRKRNLTRDGWVAVRVVGGEPGALCWEPEKSQDVQAAAYISEKDEKQTFGFHLWGTFKTLVRGISVGY